ncbi:MAG: zf-TFIIB domain-containing protein [Alphaproteobacteria bacterium]|nr:zf-TFIIB domain-containing protein [Alphaproteobacteria bacterium]
MSTREPLLCPRNHGPLTQEVLDGRVVVDRCPACGGVWLDQGELTALETLHLHDLDDEAPEEIVPPEESVSLAFRMAQDEQGLTSLCPKCFEEMGREEHEMGSQVLVDVCPAGHGMWLDGGELDVLLRYYAQAHREAEESDGLRGLWARFVREIKEARRG